MLLYANKLHFCIFDNLTFPKMHLHRNKYDTTIPWLYSQNKEYLLPKEFRETIPCSTIFFWRNSQKPFYGLEFSNIRTESLEWYELLHERNHLQKTVKVIAKVWIGLSTILTTLLQKTKEYNEHLVDAVQQLTTVFPKSLACKIVRISKATFDYRLSNLKIKCGISPLDLCFKRHPLQLATGEVQSNLHFQILIFLVGLRFQFITNYYGITNYAFR